MTKLIKTLQEKEGFSESESMIADFLLANYRGLAGISTRQLAKLTYTSSAAIVRFSQKLGFEGYTEFKVSFMAEMIQYKYNTNAQNAEGFNSKDSVKEIIKKVTSMEINAIQETNNILDPAAIVMTLSYITKAEHVDFYATDNNLNIANMAAESLIMAEKTSTVVTSIPQMYLLSANAPTKHLSFFISRTGENRMLIDMARTIKSRGGKIVLLTAEPDSTLGNLADQILTVSSVKKLEELGTRIFVISAKYIVDIIFAAMVAKKGMNSIQEKEKWLISSFRY